MMMCEQLRMSNTYVITKLESQHSTFIEEKAEPSNESHNFATTFGLRFQTNLDIPGIMGRIQFLTWWGGVGWGGML